MVPDIVLIMNGTTEPFDGKEANKFETSGDSLAYQLRSVILSQLCYLPAFNLPEVEEMNREDHLELGWTLWGEMTPSSEECALSADLQKILLLKAMKQEPLKLYQPCTPPFGEPVIVPLECSKMDGKIIQTLPLVQHYRRLETLITDIQTAIKHTNEVELLIIEAAITFVQWQQCKLCTPFHVGVGEPLFKLSSINTRHILRKSVAAVLAHTGYERKVKKPFGKINLSTPDRDLTLDLAIIVSIVNCKSSTLDHAAIKSQNL
uniref:Uncharacterized protein n=1 Tax=Timema tahoe TaxID=61484 RepID=A0A7R9IKL2_9NEOP|nr:unnamed protein product [Timema tahoe]